MAENPNPPEPSQTDDESISELSQTENEPTPEPTQLKIPLEQTEESPGSEHLDQPKRALPQNPVEILNLTKSGGITLPKSIREQLDEKQAFAFWMENDRYMLMPVKEYEIPDLKLVADIQKEKKRQTAESSGTEGSDSKQKRKSRSKSKTQITSGPQPELTKYFPYSLENQEKIQSGIEASFYKLLEDPPKIEEVIERIKYMIINYGTGRKTNDARLKHTIILFAIDAVEKVREHDLTPLLQYVGENIVDHIESAYLYEQSLVFLCGTALNIDQNQFAFSFLQKIFAVIDHYEENFTIMQGLKSLTKTIIQAEKPLTEEFQLYLRNGLRKYVIGPVLIGENEQIIHKYPLTTDSSMEIIELLENLHMFDAAYDAANYLLGRIQTEDVHIESVRAKVNELAKK